MIPELTPAQWETALDLWRGMAWPVVYDGEWWVWRTGPDTGKRIPEETFEEFMLSWERSMDDQAEALSMELFNHAKLSEEDFAQPYSELKAQKLSYYSRDITKFETGMQRFLKLNHAMAFVVGIGDGPYGDTGFFTPQDMQALNKRLRAEFKYLRGFTQAIRRGLSVRGIIQRAKMYVQSVFGSMMTARIRKAIRDGYRWKMNSLDKGAAHCEGCIAIAAFGWVPITHPFPAPGVSNELHPRQCLSRCRCRLHLSKSRQRPGSRKDGSGWLLDGNGIGWLQPSSQRNNVSNQNSDRSRARRKRVSAGSH